jgi:cyclohexanecarboxylate-CoA ligase
MTSYDNLTRRRAAMIAAGYWRDQTLLDHLNRAIKRTPDKTAIVAIRSESAEEKRLAYNEIDRLSDTLAVRLAQLGIGRGDTVSFQLPNWWQFPVLHLACLRHQQSTRLRRWRQRQFRFCETSRAGGE